MIVFMILLIGTISGCDSKSKDYEAAKNLLETGYYDLAEVEFAKLGDYKDSKKQLENVGKARKYDEASQLVSEGYYGQAIQILASLDGYKDSSELTNKYKDKISIIVGLWNCSWKANGNVYIEYTEFLEDGTINYTVSKNAEIVHLGLGGTWRINEEQDRIEYSPTGIEKTYFVDDYDGTNWYKGNLDHSVVERVQ